MNNLHKVNTCIDEHQLYWFTLNRPDIHHAIDYDVMDELQKAINIVKDDYSIRAFIITGSGDKSFCSGGDLSVFHKLHTQQEAYGMLSRMGEILYSLMMLPIPTYALVNGTAIGGGCEIASACDQRWAAEHAKVGFVQGSLGITTGWGGASMLFEKISTVHAMEMLTSGAIYTVKEAEKFGFIQKVLPKGNMRNRNISESIVSSSAVLRSYKEALIAKWQQTDLKERMFAEIEKCSILWEQDEHHEAVSQFLKNKKK